MDTDAALTRLGWKSFFAGQLTPEELGSLVPARVSTVQRSHLQLWTAATEISLPIAMTSRLPTMAVGDWLLMEPDLERPRRLLNRYSLIERKASGHEQTMQLIAANIDVLLIVTSCNQDFNINRLERYLALARDAGVMPLIVLTKVDEIADADIDAFILQTRTLRSDLAIEAIDARDPQTLDGLRQYIVAGQTLAMVGSSGVGKSTLATSLGTAVQATASIRSEDGKGRHTTTWRSLLRLPGDGLLIDNPGMRELQLTGDDEALVDIFADLLTHAQCRFTDCKHDSEPGCGVLAAIERGDLDPRRLESYHKLAREQVHNRQTLAEQRRGDRAQSRYYKSVQTASRNRKKT